MLSQPQQKLLDLLAKGWTATVYFDDSRTRYYSPTGEVQRGNEKVVLALLVRDMISILHSCPDHVTYTKRV